MVTGLVCFFILTGSENRPKKEITFPGLGQMSKNNIKGLKKKLIYIYTMH